MAIQLYTGINSELRVTPGQFITDKVMAVLVKDTYVFDEYHSVEDLLDHTENNPVELTFKSYGVYEDGFYFDCNDATIIGQSDSVSYLALYFENGLTQPIALYDGESVWGLPGTPRGGPVALAFSNSIRKVLAVTSDGAESGQVLISFVPPSTSYSRVTTISRPENTITANQRMVSDKNSTKESIYIDINLTGHSHPLTGDLTYSVNQYAINQSLKNILLTSPTERPFSNIGFGGGINALLFELGDPLTLLDARINITNSITNFEPRIILNQLDVEMVGEQNGLNITVQYTIKSTNQRATFELFLERV